jgi:hypothetical protein
MPDEPSQSDAASKPRGQAGAEAKTRKPQAGAGGAAATPRSPHAGEGGAGGQTADCAQETEKQDCGPCQACADDNKCEPVTGRDDADSCSETRSCSSRGVCLRVSEAQADLGTMLDWATLTTSYAQVVSFTEPASIEEIRLEVSCSEDDQTFPSVWLAATRGGLPTDTVLATANVLYQSPTATNNFALLELSKVLEEPEAGPIAIVVGMTAMNCMIRLNKEDPYTGGALFTKDTTTGLWTPSEGSMVFQVLSSKASGTQ